MQQDAKFQSSFLSVMNIEEDKESNRSKGTGTRADQDNNMPQKKPHIGIQDG